jgi:hypothetical protein
MAARFDPARELDKSRKAGNGFVQSGGESLAETMARALGINTDELRFALRKIE